MLTLLVCHTNTDPMRISLGYFWPRLPKVKVLIFKPFWPRIPMVKALFFLGPFWSRLPTVKVFVFLGHFWTRLPTVKVFVFHGHFWPRLLLLATLAMNTNDESYVCDLRFWATSGIPLRQTRVRVRWRQSLAHHCATRSSHSGRCTAEWNVLKNKELPQGVGAWVR